MGYFDNWGPPPSSRGRTSSTEPVRVAVPVMTRIGGFVPLPVPGRGPVPNPVGVGAGSNLPVSFPGHF